MTAQIFEDWFESEFVPRVTDFLSKSSLSARAILLIDNCKSHISLKVGEIETIFLSPDVTSIIQPLDQGILEYLRKRYKIKLLTAIFDAQKLNVSLKEFLKIVSLKETIDWISESWNEINSRTIYKCWNKLLPVDTRDVATQTDNQPRVLTCLDLNVESGLVDCMLSEENARTSKMLSILRQIRGFESISENEVEKWLPDAGLKGKLGYKLKKKPNTYFYLTYK